MSHCSKKDLVSRNELRETENIGATDLDELIANFLLQVREFLFLICVKKTISMKILVLRVINSSRHRNCFVRGYIHELFVSKARTSEVRASEGFHTNNSWIYIYIYIYIYILLDVLLCSIAQYFYELCRILTSP